jgi:hypothetical protein
LEHLKTVRRKEVAESLEYARSLGDISENAEYQEARDMQAAIEERIQYLEKVIKEAKIVAHANKGDVVGLGSSVTIQRSRAIKRVTHTPSLDQRRQTFMTTNSHSSHRSVRRSWGRQRAIHSPLKLQVESRRIHRVEGVRRIIPTRENARDLHSKSRVFSNFPFWREGGTIGTMSSIEEIRAERSEEARYSLKGARS